MTIRIDLPERFRSSVCVVAGSEIVRPDQWLTDEEATAAGNIPLHRRREEWILGRVAAKQLAMELGLCDLPRECSIPSRGVKPRLFLHGQLSLLEVSLSHSGQLAAATIDERSVGIDIQVRRRIDPRSTRFFLRDEEAALAVDPDDETLLDLWSAKEAALKASGVRRYRQVVLEKRDATTFHFEAGTISGDVETTWLDERSIVLAIARSAA